MSRKRKPEVVIDYTQQAGDDVTFVSFLDFRPGKGAEVILRAGLTIGCNTTIIWSGWKGDAPGQEHLWSVSRSAFERQHRRKIYLLGTFTGDYVDMATREPTVPTEGLPVFDIEAGMQGRAWSVSLGAGGSALVGTVL